jgi:L-cysteine desulfidase
MYSENPLWTELLKAVKAEVAPALGCTEPIALALAAAIAARQLGEAPHRIEARVSANLMKNGMGVTVPGTGMVGLPIAAAVGALGGDADAGLEVLHRLNAATVTDGKRMLNDGLVSVTVADDIADALYAEARLIGPRGEARACIAGTHTHVTLIEKDGVVQFEDPCNGDGGDNAYDLSAVRARDVYDFATSAPLDGIRFILDAARLNDRLSHEGMAGDYGLHIGATLRRQVAQGLLSADLLTEILARASAASDARMGGATLPAMSNSGSGNQGIVATLPVVVVAEHVGADEEKLARALMLSHLMAIYIHSRLPKLSALCAATTAAMGAAAGMAWLLAGDFRPVAMAICSMIGDVAGVICDGASNSCAMKVSTSAAAAYKAVLMALDNARVSGNDGIVDEDVDASIVNLCALASDAMRAVDRQILQIMVKKPQHAPLVS